MKGFTIYDIVRKLTGHIQPAGDSTIDAKRYQYLEAQLSLIDEMLRDVAHAAHCANDSRDSMRKIGKRAADFLAFLGEEHGAPAAPQEYQATGDVVNLPVGWYWIQGRADNDEVSWDLEKLYSATHAAYFLQNCKTYEGESVVAVFGPLHMPAGEA